MLAWGPTIARLSRSRLFQVPSLIALVVLVIMAALTSPTASDGSHIFFEIGNLTDILRQVSVIGIISLGMTLVILTGGIDLSVGSVLALSTALVASLLTRNWAPGAPTVQMMLAIAAAVLACGLVGALNGLVVARLQVQPFIVTLASMIGVRGQMPHGQQRVVRFLREPQHELPRGNPTEQVHLNGCDKVRQAFRAI